MSRDKAKNFAGFPDNVDAKTFAAHVRMLPSVSFTNKHGEKFIFYGTRTSVFMEGDEVNMMVNPKHTVDGLLPLFNDHFNIWDEQELYNVGLMLQRLYAKAQL